MKFKLASVLTLRENVEKQVKRELGQANMKLEKIQVEKRKFENKRESIYISSRENKCVFIDVQTLKQSNNYLAYLQKEIIKKEEEEKVAELEVKRKKEKLVDAVKDRKILENLKQVQYEEYLAKLRQKENELLDELVSYKYSSKESRA